MRKLRWFGPALALWVALTPSCLGGQTGQPTSGRCGTTTADDTWRGRTVQELAAAFEGSHRATLQWNEEALEAKEKTPVDFSDEITLTVDATAATGTVVSCNLELDVEVTVEVTTSQSGLSQRGIGTLTFGEDLASVLTAQLSFDGSTLRVDAALTQTDAATAPQGWLSPEVMGTPGRSASFR
jgi:hypothetical protein